MHAIRLMQIEALANSMRLRDIVRFCLVAPRFVLELLAHVAEVRAFYDGQIARLQADVAELRGRRSVEIEAAAREGWRQAQANYQRPAGPPAELVLGPVYRAAHDAKPTEVTGELKMVGKSRHGT